ncbi:MAG: hypothetical protein LBH40_06425 [Alphaproteobacteria bacterium]|nr:hypothetical protein [Alphaproteobacteria bacterium]
MFFIFSFILLNKTIIKYKYINDIDKTYYKLIKNIASTHDYPLKKGNNLILKIPKSERDFIIRCFYADWAVPYCENAVKKYSGGHPDLKFEITDDDSTEYKIIEKKNNKP